MLNARYFIPGCTVILGDLRFYDDLWIKLARDDKVRRLVKTFDTLCTFGLAKTNAGLGKYILYG